MMSLSDIIACKTGLDDYVRGELHGNQESDIHSVIETLSKTVPLQWDSPESDALVWVAENAHLASGIYLISGCRTIFPDEWVKLTGSFHDLLRFLEGNAYPIPEHSVLEPFLSSDGVIQRPDLQDKVVSMMKRVIPSE